jgi:hypothetical protein
VSSNATPIEPRDLVSRSLLAEVAAYLGAPVAAAGAALIVARHSPGTSGEIVTATLFVAVLLGVGFAVGDDTPRRARLRGVMWFLGVLSWFTLVAIVVVDALDMASRAGAIVASILAIAGGLAVWLLCRRSLQQIALYVAVVALVGSVAFPTPTLFGGFDTTTVGALLWLLGIVWMAVAARGIITPRRTGLVLGAVTAVATPVYLLRISASTLGDVLGLLTAFGLLVVGGLLADRAVDGIGVAGLLILGSFVVEAHAGTSQTAAIVIGLALLGAAVALIRSDEPAAPPAGGGGAFAWPPPTDAPPPPAPSPPPGGGAPPPADPVA